MQILHAFLCLHWLYNIFKMQNVFSEKCCFSWTICLLQEHKIFSGENLAHLKTSNTKVDMRGRYKKRTQAVYRLLSCVQYISSSCLIICCCKAEDTNGVLQQFMELHLYEQKEEKTKLLKQLQRNKMGVQVWGKRYLWLIGQRREMMRGYIFARIKT